jgi:hypothetical protein
MVTQSGDKTGRHRPLVVFDLSNDTVQVALGEDKNVLLVHPSLFNLIV